MRRRLKFMQRVGRAFKMLKLGGGNRKQSCACPGPSRSLDQRGRGSEQLDRKSSSGSHSQRDPLERDSTAKRRCIHAAAAKLQILLKMCCSVGIDAGELLQ